MSHPPLVVLGLDAGDPCFFESWLAEGRLPTMASLVSRGVWGRTGGPELISEHGIWLSLFSGISRGRHGYYYYRQLVPGTYDLRTIAGRDVDVQPFWAQLAGSNRTVAIVDAPDIPVLPSLDGIQLADWATHTNWDNSKYPLVSHPPALVADVASRIGDKQVMIERHTSTVDEDRALLVELLARVERKGELCRYLAGLGRFDLVVCVFAEIHAASHQFWRYQPGLAGGGSDAPELADAIAAMYEAVDRELGRLLATLPSGANIAVVSSVGLEDHFPTTHLIEAFLRDLGYEYPATGAGLSLRPLDLARRLLPESWRVAVSRHFARETRERLLADAFRAGTDWERTRAFSIPAAYTSFIRVNLRGREPEGIVEPGAEYEALLDDLEGDLAALVDPVTGEAAVRHLARATDLFGTVPTALPDLFVEWKPGRFMERVAHPRAVLEQRRPEFYRRSDHSHNGFVALAGPAVSRRGALGDVDLLDLAPTFLSLLGMPVPAELQGQPLEL